MTTCASNVTIRRLQLHAQAHWQQLIHPRLEQVQWPEPGPDEYLFIRRLSLSVRDTELATSLSSLVAQLTGQAADGQQPGVETAQVVRFPSYTRLLVTLTEDLHCQRAKSRWFWRDWQHLQGLPTAEAITELWASAPLHLAELCARLSANGNLVTIWKQFSPTQFQHIGLALAYSAGVAPDATNPAPKIPPKTGLPPLLPPRRLLQRWEKVLTITDAEHSPATRLAALLTLLEWRPDVLLSAFAGEAVRTIGEHLIPGTVAVVPVSASHGRAERPESLIKETTASPATPDTVSVANASGPKMANDSRPDLSVAMDGDSNKSRDLSPPNTAPEILSTGQANEENSIEENPVTSDSAATGPRTFLDEYEFSTRFGGLFYLLNFLNQNETLELIDRSGGFAALSGGWGWLCQLGVSIGLEADPSLAQFIAAQLGTDTPDPVADLPPLPNEDAFLTLFQQRYLRLQPWPSRLLARPARVTATASHLDLYFHLQSVDLDIRLTGLDIDPGWLPWLGRVVRFHFLENPFVGEGSLQ